MDNDIGFRISSFWFYNIKNTGSLLVNSPANERPVKWKKKLLEVWEDKPQKYSYILNLDDLKYADLIVINCVRTGVQSAAAGETVLRQPGLQ